MSSPGRVFVLEVSKDQAEAMRVKLYPAIGEPVGRGPSATRAAQYSPWNLAAGDRSP